MGTTTANFGIVEHARSHEFYACEFAAERDAHGVYHILRAAGPFPRANFVNDSEDEGPVLRDDGGEMAFAQLAHWPTDAEAAWEGQGRLGTDELGRWLDQQPGDLW